ncbi:MAG: transglycosylase domain-containing protein, partial [Porticoccaceae bacterium]|nr:transglycosylase domain-containing protein [Porticoccaceae bacterium]
MIPVTLVLDFMVRAKFEGSKWALPAHVYSRALDLYQGLQLDAGELVWELDKLGYRASAVVNTPGQYRRNGNQVEFYSRGFRFWDGDEPAQRLRVSFAGNQLSGLNASGQAAAVARLEPLRIGGIFPEHLEDRELVRLEALPPYLIDGLLAVEDQHFDEHNGVSLRGIGRAMMANLRARELAQGGSTITQQLVKNFYLTNDRKLWRKLVEIPMALLLELHYDKAEILEAYINEVYLGQAGKRAIHGFGLASRHYFRQPVGELDVHQVALLIALVKGASYYDPWRNRGRALKRRNLVLDVMASHRLIDKSTAASAKAKELGVVARRATAFNDYPAYLDLVKRQLRRDYSGDDLRREGLRIFTNFDPQAQRQLEKSIANRLDNLEQGYRIDKGQLQAGAVVAR